MAAPEQQQIKSNIYLLASDADVGTGAPSAVSGFPSSTIGFSGGSDAYNRYAQGTWLWSRAGQGGTTSNLYLVTTNGSGTKVAILVASASAGPSGGGSSAPDIVYVVAKSGTYTSPALSAAVYTTIAAAIAAAPASGAAILILNDSYTETLTINKPVDLIGFSNASKVTITGPMSVTTTTAPVILRNISVAGGASAAVTLSASAIVSAYNCAFTGAATVIAQGGAATINLTECSVTGGIVVSTQTLLDTTVTGTSTAATSMSAIGCTMGNTSSAASTFRNTFFTGTLGVTGTSSALTMDDCRVTGAFTCAITAARTVRDCIWSAGCTFAGAITMVRCTNESTATAPSLTAQQGYITGLLTTSGTLSLNQSVFLGGVTYTGTTGSVTADGCQFLGTMSFTRAVTARNCSFTRTTAGAAVALNSAAAQSSRFDQCIFTTSAGNGMTVATNDTAAIADCVWNVSTFIATSGAGSTQVIGAMPGGARITTTGSVNSVSDMIVTSEVSTTGGSVTMASLTAGAAIADMFRFNSVIAFPGATLDFYAGSEVPDGWIVTVVNIGTQNSFTMQASVGDTFTGEPLVPPGATRRYKYLRTGSTATIVGVG